MVDTKERIIKAARDLFEINGYGATTTKEIAAKAGVSEVTLFRHFETKRNLFVQTVHSSLHPYKLEEYLEKDVQYDLEKDMHAIAKNMMKAYQNNLPLMKMVFKDKMYGSLSKLRLGQHEKRAKNSLESYFEQMHAMGRMKADPNMAMIFFMNNIAGYIFKSTFSLEGHHHRHIANNSKYFDWMMERVIFALKNDPADFQQGTGSDN